MNEALVRKLLLEQYKRYPKMQIQDMVKLIFQSEFAGGHLIQSEEDSLRRLQAEFESLSFNEGHQSPLLFEEIGNGLCRLNLRALKDSDINLRTVNRFFVCTANQAAGSIQSFEAELDIFRKCCRDKELPYLPGEVEAYLLHYKNQGFPAVSHSASFRAHYQPAYRIVKSGHVKYFKVFCEIDALLKTHESINLAIDIFHMDDFFLRPELKTESRMKEVGGNVDYVRFKEEVVAGLKTGREFQYRIYDCRRRTLGNSIRVVPKKLNIIEGSYSMHPTLADYYNLKIFLRIDAKEQSRRILQRNGPVMHRSFIEEWIPKENQYFDRLKIEDQCDFVFINN